MNITGTLALLEEAVRAGVESFVFTSTTSAFGRALTPPPGAPAAWITEDVAPVPRNIYGVTKTAAEDLCELVHRDSGLPVVVLRTSRFFPEGDDRDDVRAAYEDANSKVNEFLYRRVDIADVVDAHLLALERAPRDRLRALHRERDHAVRPRRPGRAARPTPRRSWRASSRIRRPRRAARLEDVPDARPRLRQREARAELGWEPRYDFRRVLELLEAGEDSAARSRSRSAQGLPRGVHRALHGALSRFR